MTDNKNEPAFPEVRTIGDEYVQVKTYISGLTKREWFAGMALYGAMIADIERAKLGTLPSGNADQELADSCMDDGT